MTISFWLRLRWLLRLWIFLAAITFAPPAIFAYDAENQTTVAYDTSGEFAVGYDAVSVLATGEKKSGTAGDRVPFAKFAGFLAIKEGIYSFKEAEGTYIGQSGNVPQRLRAHELSGKKASGVNATVTEVSGGKTAREVAEHKKIQEVTGGVPAKDSIKVTNQRDPIGPIRQHLLDSDQ